MEVGVVDPLGSAGDRWWLITRVCSLCENSVGLALEIVHSNVPRIPRRCLYPMSAVVHAPDLPGIGMQSPFISRSRDRICRRNVRFLGA